ncbi:MAG: hypothetical protein A3G87_03980 [Omnitrophica bacterium RIFCSPLOWO2_12_FULL_50_11]|nr:MAG: hypothetical protein A3G87_03980 [Omnitrophica bacterium RIFCSPLOWO2_12_FULL_50_11]
MVKRTFNAQDLPTGRIEFDQAGNVTELLDNGAPAGRLVINLDAPATNARDITLEIDVIDNISPRHEIEMALSLDGGQTFRNFEPLSATKNITLPELDGEHTIGIRVRDKAGNTRDLRDTITLDRAAPTGGVSINRDAQKTNVSRVTLTLDVTDNFTMQNKIEMAFSQDGINFTPFETFNETKLLTLEGDDGEKTVTVRFRDEAGNFRDFSDTILLETILDAPTVDPLPAYVKRSFLTISGTKPSGTMIWINGRRAEEWAPDLRPLLGSSPDFVNPDETAWSYFIELPDLKDDGDTQSLSITAKDESGDESLPVELDLTLEQTRPTFSLSTLLREGDTIPQTGIHLEGTAGDEHFTEVLISLYYPRIGYTLYKQAASYDPQTQTWQYDIPEKALIEGQAFGLSIYGYDEAGNKQGTYLPLKTGGTPDTTPPQISITSHTQGETVSDQSFLLTGTVSDNTEVSRIYVRFYDPLSRTFQPNLDRPVLGRSHQLADFDPEVGSWSFPVAPNQLTADHPILVYYSALDTRGNASSWQSIELSVRDLAQPTGSIVINGDATHTNSADVTLALVAMDNVTAQKNLQMAFSQDGINFTPFEPFNTTKTLTLEGGDGEKIVHVSFRDEALNESSFSASIVLDTTPPVILPSPWDHKLRTGIVNPRNKSFERFGESVAVDNKKRFLIGAPGGRAAHLLDGDPESTTFRQLLRTFQNPDPDKYDDFGQQVAFVGDHVLIAAPGPFGVVTDTRGFVYLFNGDPASPEFGNLLHTFRPSGGIKDADFGSAMTIIGKYIFIGSPEFDLGAGTVSMYDADPQSATFGKLLHQFQNPLESTRQFGRSITSVGNHIVVGGSGSSSAFMFDADPLSPSFGALLRTFSNPGQEPVRNFYGDVLAGSAEGYVVMRAKVANVNGITQVAYVFDARTDSSTFGQLLETISDPSPDSGGFVLFASVSEDTIFIGDGSAAGTVYVFNGKLEDPGFGSLVETIRNPDPENFDRFGVSFAVFPGGLLVGVPGDNKAGRESGAVYFYERLQLGLINGDSSRTSFADVTLTFKVEDAISSQDHLEMAFSVDGGETFTSFEPFQPTEDLTLTGEDGTKVVVARFRDQAGNIVEAQNSIILQRPTITINDGEAYTGSRFVEAQINNVWNESGFQIAFSVDNGQSFTAYERFVSSKELTLPAGEGLKKVIVRLKDNEGKIIELTATIELKFLTQRALGVYEITIDDYLRGLINQVTTWALRQEYDIERLAIAELEAIKRRTLEQLAGVYDFVVFVPTGKTSSTLNYYSQIAGLLLGMGYPEKINIEGIGLPQRTLVQKWLDDNEDFGPLFKNLVDPFLTEVNSASPHQGTAFINMIEIREDAGSILDLSSYIRLTLLQEIAHRWGTYLTSNGKEENDPLGILGRGNTHWSPFFNAATSPMDGILWEDLGNGRFQMKKWFGLDIPFVPNSAFTNEFNDFDLYAMGVISDAEVSSSFVIDNPRTNILGWALTEENFYNFVNLREAVVIQGTRRDVSISDITAIEGERKPTASESQKDFSVALVTIKTGNETKSDIDFIRSKVDEIATSFRGWWSRATRGLSSMTLGPVAGGFEIFRQLFLEKFDQEISEIETGRNEEGTVTGPANGEELLEEKNRAQSHSASLDSLERLLSDVENRLAPLTQLADINPAIQESLGSIPQEVSAIRQKMDQFQQSSADALTQADFIGSLVTQSRDEVSQGLSQAEGDGILPREFSDLTEKFEEIRNRYAAAINDLRVFSSAFESEHGALDVQLNDLSQAIETISETLETPHGSITINGGTSHVNNPQVILSLEAQDLSTPRDKIEMAFSFDGGNSFSAFEAFNPTKEINLQGDDGEKEIIVRFRDESGKAADVSDTIVLDREAPRGEVSINRGAQETDSLVVTLNLRATDNLSAVDDFQMAFSLDGGTTFTSFEPFSPTKQIPLEGEDGEKQVIVRFKDEAGNTEDFSDTITLTTFTNPPVTFAGDARIDTSQFKFGGASVVFDGAGDYAASPDSPDWDFGTGDFTIDFWVRFNNLDTVAFYSRNAGSAGGVLLQWNAGQGFVVGLGAYAVPYTFAWSSSTNVWYHVAVVRSSTSVFVFIDGAQIGTTATDSGPTDLDTTTAIFIASHSGTSQFLKGWLDEFRVSKGVARWTSGFAPPSSEHQPDQDTVLLLHLNAPLQTQALAAFATELVRPSQTRRFTDQAPTLSTPLLWNALQSPYEEEDEKDEEEESVVIF